MNRPRRIRRALTAVNAFAAFAALAALAALPALAVALAAACGPITYVGEVNRASDAVDAARAVQADKYAPYWWTRATQYLHKAREVAARADFQGANRFGRLATEAAGKAAEEAVVAARDPSRRRLDVPPDVAPAKDSSPAPVAPAKDAP